MKHFLTVRSLALVLLTAVLAAPASAQPLADVTPADVELYIAGENLAEVRENWQDDPLRNFLKSQMPGHRSHRAWKKLQDKLDMSGEQLFDTYFGRSVALVARKAHRRAPALLLSRVSNTALKRLTTLDLQPLDVEIEGFDLYQTPNGKALIGIGDGLLAFARQRHQEHLVSVLTDMAGETARLADDETFQQWTDRLPEERLGTAFYNRPDDKGTHVLGFVLDAPDLTIRYAGQGGEWTQFIAEAGQARTTEFGPLPASTLGVMMVNHLKPHPHQLRFLNMMLAPANWQEDVRPKLAAPAVSFIGEVPGAEANLDPNVYVPAVGFAMKMTDASVAEDLDRMFTKAFNWANLLTMRWKVDPLKYETPVHDGVTFNTIDLGRAVAERLERSEFAGLKPAWGAVGNWYIVCSQDRFFTRIIDAEKDPTMRFKATPAFAGMAVTETDEPMITGVMTAPAFAQHVRRWVDYIGEQNPALIEGSDEVSWRIRKAHRKLRVLSGLMRYYNDFTMQAWLDGDVVEGKLVIDRKEID
ncbi:MAG: hypothetical protein R3336_04145 [Phycisphaeraceae bacterium]|nr:hypothetical protein [Phycisphaeraceae bacterium]